MLTVTLDTNCINDLIESRAGTRQMKSLIQLANCGIVSVGVPAISGSENLAGRTRPDNFSQFTEKIEKAGLTQQALLLPLAIWGVTFWGKSLWASDDMKKLELDLQAILFPSFDFSFPKPDDFADLLDFNRARALWFNRKCDVLVAWTHIYYRRNVFLTRDANFTKDTKLPKLLGLGIGSIESPEEFLLRFPA